MVWRYGTDHKLGGPHDAPNAGEILCAALAACMDNIYRMLAGHLGIELLDLEVEVTGDVDVRGCMAIDPEVSEAVIAVEGEPLRPSTHTVITETPSGEWAIGGQPFSAEDIRAKRGV